MSFPIGFFPTRLKASFRRWLRDSRAVATVEFVLVTPAMLMLMAIVVFAAQGFELQRKVTLTMRTLTDLVTQQSDISVANAPTYNINQVLAAASLVMAPYDPTLMQMVISEVKVTGATTAVVQWSKATGTSAVALTAGATVTIPSNLAATGTFLVLGTVNYNYNPLQILLPSNAITLSDSIYMAPRISGSINCC